MELISLATVLITAAFIGFNILYLIAGGFNRLYLTETAFISYALGVGFISLEMLLFYLLGLKFSISGILIPWAFLVAINAYRYVKSGSRFIFADQPPVSDEKNRFLNIFLASGITLEVVYAFFRALIKPIEAYDAVAIYAIKSKIFFLAKAIPDTYFPSLVHGFPHPDYPLNIPLTETFMYLAMRNLNDQLVKIIFPLFFLGILSVLYFAIRRFASRTYALVFTFLLASIPMFNSYAANAYQELPLAFYYFASAVFLLAWIEDRKDLRFLAVSAVMVALAGWTKNEGMLYCAINASLVIYLSITTRKETSVKTIYAPILYLAVIGIILAPWIWIKARFGIVNDEINLLNLNPVYLLKQLPKLGPIFYELQKQLFGPKKWILLWPIAIFAAIFNYRKIFTGAQKYISISLILAFCGYVVFYMISYVDVVFFASKTWGRFLLHFLPLLVLWLAYMLKEDIKL
ncbi:MAG: glycosyltransferase family 39 protein [Candidatus Omnitrophica bacterium]|nr:glycosyltransferase family 39 protein [Candidatus Omnitrophota bacterium]